MVAPPGFEVDKDGETLNDEASKQAGFSRALAWLVVVLGLATMAATTYVGVRSYSPVLFADEWQLPMDWAAMGWRYPVATLWAQHNEHRIPFQNLLEFAGMFWFHGNHAFLLIIGWFVQAAQVGAFAFFLKRTRELTQSEWLSAIGLAIFCVFNPLLMQIFLWGFSPSVLGSYFFAVVSLGALTMYAAREKEGLRVTRWIALAIISAFLSESNLASGVLVWVMLPICGLLAGLRWRTLALLAAAGVVGIAIYLIGYKTPPNATSPLEAITHPFQIQHFMNAYLGESWHYIWPAPGDRFAAWAVAGVLFFSIAGYVEGNKHRSPLAAFAWSVAGFVILASFVTSLGRQGQGVEQAREGRYQAAAVLFWLAVGIMAIPCTRKAGRYRIAAFIAVQLIICFGMVRELTQFPELMLRWTPDGYTKSLAGMAVEQGVPDLAMISHIYPAPAAVIPTYNKLIEHGAIRPFSPEYRLVGKRLTDFIIMPAAGCDGSTDAIQVIAQSGGQLDVTAYGWDGVRGGSKVIRSVFATDDGKTIAGAGIAVGYLNRWQLYAKVPAEAKRLFVYALMSDGKTACLLPGMKDIPTAKLP